MVGFQIQQNSELTRAAMYSEWQDGWIEVDGSLQSEGFSTVLARSIETPENLTTLEMLEIHGICFEI